METCVVVSQHPRNHHHHGRMGRSGGGGLYFSPPPSRAFSGINCRAFHYGAGILPPPLSAFSSSSSSSSTTALSTRPSRSDTSSPRSSRSSTDLPSPRSYRTADLPSSRSSCSIDLPFPRSSRSIDLPSPRSEPPRRHTSRRSSPIPITTKRTTSLPSQSTTSSLFGEDTSASSSHTELWAGPAYCNSPPPSSLPIPKFSLRGKRSASLDLPQQSEREDLRPLPKSAPASPTRESSSNSSPPVNRFFSDAFATADLCRILNLNLDDED